MEPLLIQFMLKAKGHSMADVARGLLSERTGEQLTPGAVRMVVLGKSRSRRIESRIAALTGQSLNTLWPEWYAPNGQPIKARRKYGRMADYLARFEKAQAPTKGAA